ncbi:O-antigen ligase family protein [Bacteriovoracales bacterium]|nr:O-antigen ligase family protein [Bacteriovoracales bacterium]
MKDKAIPSYVLNFLFFSILFSALGFYVSVSFIGLGHLLLLIPIVYLIDKKELKKTFEYAPSKFLLAFILAAALSIILNWNSIGQPLKLLFKIKYFIISLLAIPCYSYFYKQDESRNKPRLPLLLKILFISTTLATCSGIIGLYSGFNPLKFTKACSMERNCGMSGMLMTYSYSISIFCSIIFGWIINFKSNKYTTRKNLIIVFVINFVGLYLSYSRGAMLGFLAALPFSFFWKYKYLFKSAIVFSTIFTAALAYIFINKIDIDFYRLHTNSHNEKSRLMIMNTAYHAFKEKPIFGFGYRNFENVAGSIKYKYGLHNIKAPRSVKKFTGHAHNNYLEVLSGMGTLGFIAFTGFILGWLALCFTGKNTILKIILPGLLNFSVSGLFQSTLIDGEITFLIMVLFSITITNQIRSQDSKA